MAPYCTTGPDLPRTPATDHCSISGGELHWECAQIPIAAIWKLNRIHPVECMQLQTRMDGTWTEATQAVLKR